MKTRGLKLSTSLLLLAAATALIAACQPKASAGSPPSGSLYPTPGVNGTPASGSVVIDVSSNAAIGKFLVDQNGMTLYIFTKDTTGVSNCAGSCAQNWPPLTAASAAMPTAGSGVAGTLGLITRADGTMQVTYNGMPLYYYAGDKAAGDTNGQGIGGSWYAATP